jgi:hypothetical protein
MFERISMSVTVCGSRTYGVISPLTTVLQQSWVNRVSVKYVDVLKDWLLNINDLTNDKVTSHICNSDMSSILGPG